MFKLYSTITETQQALLAKEYTVTDLVRVYLDNISLQNTALNAFLEVFDSEALELAKQQDLELSQGVIKPLTGIVIGIKDLLCYKNHNSTGGSNILKGFKSIYTATAVQRLIDAGAIIIGRQNCDEFGMGSSNENSAYGPSRNAANKNKVSGGSSGGSAVAVQAKMCHASIGTDTGGSVRQPAGYCGIVGFKPTYSRVSRWGLKAYGSSFDTIGPLTQSVADAELLHTLMAGYDENDATSSTLPVLHGENFDSNAVYRICYFKDAVSADGLQAEVLEAFENKIKEITNLGHKVESVEFPLMKHFLPTYYILTTAEVSSNLSRYDGVRYGYRAENTTNLIDHYKKTRTEGFGNEAVKRIMLGTFVLSASYYDAYYTKAQKMRRLVKDATDELFEKYDFIIFPIAPTTAFDIGYKSDNPVEAYLADLYTVQANVVGNPAICIPDSVDNAGLPIGFQIMGKSFEESKLFNFSKKLI